jgi:hypothetical protein
MKSSALFLGGLLWLGSLAAADLRITGLSPSGRVVLTNTFSQGVATLEKAEDLPGTWQPLKNVFTTGPETSTQVPLVGEKGFFRAVATDLTPGMPNGRPGFTNLTRVYGRLSTIAGSGRYRQDLRNYWLPEFEGGPATNADLSRPHIAMADAAGNLYIADKNAHAIRQVRPDGRIYTVAGINQAGDAPDSATVATQAALNQPNGLWVQPDGTVFIVDLGNNKIRRLKDGMLSTVVTDPNPLLPGRGLWVNSDASQIYYNSQTVIRKWTPEGGLTTFATDFAELGNLHQNPLTGELIATDRGSNQVYRIESDGAKVPIAGTGGIFGGGDGELALETAFWGVRTAWFLPTGAYFVGTHQGSQVWYVDTDGYAHLFVNGSSSFSHAGDGTWFYNPLELRMNEIRAVTADHEGNLIITESDYGFIRKIEFLPMNPAAL